ncbi:MAG: glycoside hydrolase family 18 [Dysgonamonadaceae bacterium]|jgi:hypothetical protein|nr:glycoside hydrolase family 18 [Dysgonamonadaceae bacterium]
MKNLLIAERQQTKAGRLKMHGRCFFVLPLFLAWVIVSLSACNDWTKVEPEFGEENLEGTTKSAEYYASLREWKKTPGLPQTFVWFDSWSGGLSGDASLSGLPDSLTIASNWGGHPKFQLTEARKADMKYAQEVKGVKVVVTLFSAKVGDDVPYEDIYDIPANSSDSAVIAPAIRRYAESIYEQVVASGYDGFDWDYEPIGGGTQENYLWRNKAQRTMFVEELSYWFGKGSQRTDRGGRKPAKPGLLFLIDGEVGIMEHMDKDWPSYYVDYFVLQAYGGGALEWRISGVIDDMSKWINEGKITKEEVVSRIILTENFESYASTGGGVLEMSGYVYKPGAGMKNEGVDQQIGGFGIYRPAFDYNQGKGDYNGSPEYYFLRQGITNLYRTYYERKNAH